MVHFIFSFTMVNTQDLQSGPTFEEIQIPVPFGHVSG